MHEGRHFRILYILLNNERVTAPELAEEFGVSVRTIYRDIDTMSAAGIPIYMQGGRKGGIYLLEGYRLDKVTLSKTEQAEILLALQGLGAVQYPDIDPVLLKLGALFMSQDRDWIDVDNACKIRSLTACLKFSGSRIVTFPPKDSKKL